MPESKPDTGIRKPETEFMKVKGVGQLLTGGELAQVLGVSVKTVQRMRRRHVLPQVKLPGVQGVRYRPEDVKEFIDRMVVLEEKEK